MTTFAITFVVVLGVMLSVYWLLILRPEAAEYSALARRLRGETTASGRPAPSLVKAVSRLSAIPLLDRLLRATAHVITPLQRTIALAGFSLTPGTLLLMCGCAGAVTFLLVLTTTRLAWLGLLAGVCAAYLPLAYVGSRAKSRLLLYEEQFPEAIDLIARALRAGHAFTTGLVMVADEAPQPTAGAFRQLYEEQNYGRPLPEALRAFAERLPLLDVRFFVTAVLTQREAGGNLAEVLDNLASVIRDRFKVKRQVRVVTAHARLTGWILVCEPPALAVVLSILAPGHLTKLTSDPLGVSLVMGALVLQVIGTLIIRKLVNIEY
jgi:tight adherence protein B